MDESEASPETALAATHDRILDGAARAVARHGLARLAMRDVGECAGVARGTVYRHFPNREALLREMAQREAGRFLARWRDTMTGVPRAERLRVCFEYPARFARENPLLQRLVETDPEFVLRTVREQYPLIAQSVGELLGPVIAETEIVRRGPVSVELLVDWTCRVLLSAFLVPVAEPERLAEGLDAIHRSLSSERQAR